LFQEQTWWHTPNPSTQEVKADYKFQARLVYIMTLSRKRRKEVEEKIML
jgi:hypothetical protein